MRGPCADGIGAVIAKLTWYLSTQASGYIRKEFATSMRFIRTQAVGPFGESHPAAELCLAYNTQGLLRLQRQLPSLKIQGAEKLCITQVVGMCDMAMNSKGLKAFAPSRYHITNIYKAPIRTDLDEVNRGKKRGEKKEVQLSVFGYSDILRVRSMR